MKGYKQFLFAIFGILVIYVLAELSQPSPLDWTMTLSKDDKNPLGGYILFDQLSTFFPKARIESLQLPPIDLTGDNKKNKTAYFLIDPYLNLSSDDCDQLLEYAACGNYVFIAANDFSISLMDSLHIRTSNRFGLFRADTSRVNFTNPILRSENDYSFHSPYIEEYLTAFDTARSIVLGRTNRQAINFIKVSVGEGAFFINTSPVCFSNYFILRNNNAEYTGKALSYIPDGVSAIYWDEYYKRGSTESNNPFRFLLRNRFLRWSFWIALVSLVLYVWFGSKRKQRIIPLIEPLQNNTLDFVETVGKLYYEQHDNRNIALKKINYFLAFVRTNFYLSTILLNESFEDSLAKKTALPKQAIAELIRIIQEVNQSQSISDGLLLNLNNRIDNFYVKAG
jgi:hypothetical protein